MQIKMSIFTMTQIWIKEDNNTMEKGKMESVQGGLKAQKKPNGIIALHQPKASGLISIAAAAQRWIPATVMLSSKK